MPGFAFRTGLVCLLVAVAVCGCSERGMPGAERSPGHSVTLRRGNAGEPDTLDPSLAEEVHAFRILRDLYEGLLTEAADGSLIPGVAAEWAVSGDGRSYRFRLREDATWSDGSAVTADDFVASFRRTLSPDSQSALAFLLGPVLNSEAVMSGRLPPENLGIRAVGESELEIELTNPTPYFPAILAMPIAYPLHRGTLQEGHRFADPAQFVGNGPYRLQSRQPGLVVRLEKNRLFHDAESVEIPVVEYFAIVDPVTEFNMFAAGELDITATVPPAMVANLRAERPRELRISPALALYYVALDLGEAPMNEVDLRLALSLAVDRDRLVEIIGRGEAPAFGIVPDGVAGYEPARFGWRSLDRATREEQARAAYQEAGYGPDRQLEFTLMYDVGDVHETVAIAVSAMWRDVLGAKVRLDKREWNYFLDSRSDRTEWQAMRFAWLGDYNDANTFLEIFRSDSLQNLPGFNDPVFDALLDRADIAQDLAVRAELMAQAEERLLATHAVVPLYFFVNKHLVSERVLNYEPNILDVHPSRHIALADSERRPGE